ncbi:MAG: hypothetical protein M1469_01005 [Bacteroidetes bacterium]|nr:hypothetical protein [Bacteroidota bacterium]
MTRRLHASVLKYVVVAIIVCAGIADAQMVNPSIDNPNEPFSYFSKPTDVIGVMDGKWGTEVTPKGYLYTGYGELMFFTGDPPEPVNHRVKTLLDGYLPVISYRFQRRGVEYTVTAFAATLDGNPESPLMNFIRVKMKDVVEHQRAAFFGVGIRYQGNSNMEGGTADHCFIRPIKRAYLGGREQAGVVFNPDWKYGFAGDTFLREDSVMYVFPDHPSPNRMMTLETLYNYPQNLKPRRMLVLPTTPVGIVNYMVILKPGQERILDFKMPYTPIPAGSPLVKELRDARFDDYLNRTVTFWQDILSQGIDIGVPEPKVVNTFKTSLVYDLIARNKEDGYYIQKVNDFQYHAFWLRDASFITRMYILSGYFNIAHQCLDFFPRWQQPDGNFVSQGGQFDGWGQTMWIYGQYYRFTHDNEFAEKVYPSILKAFDWLVKARASDPLHLMPETSPGDNENIEGHITGHNFWALDGLKNMIAVAEGLGETNDAEKFQREYTDFYGTLMKRLKVVTAKTGGYIPPGLDEARYPGQDWGNMLTLYPEMLFPPFNRMVTATLDSTRAKYREGIMTYGNGKFLHDYLTIRNTQDELVRNEQETALKEFYALLLHTSSTNAGFEFAIHPWGTREYDGNLAPHGWYAAEIRTLIRNMMVREQSAGSRLTSGQGDLHLLSCISPDWVRDGKEISVRRAPTYFGEVNFVLAFKKGGATLTLSNHFTTDPKHLVLHLPWFMEVKSVMADGKELKVSHSEVYLPVDSRNVQIAWAWKSGRPALSYENAVKNYERKYREKYEVFLETGK